MMTLRIHGVETAIRKMRRIKNPKIYKKILRAVIAAGAREIAKYARKEAPVDTGTLKKSIGVRMKVYKDNKVIAVVGPRRKFIKEINGKKRWASKYAHLAHKRYPFLARAIYISQRQAKARMIAEWKKQYRKYYAQL